MTEQVQGFDRVSERIRLLRFKKSEYQVKGVCI